MVSRYRLFMLTHIASIVASLWTMSSWTTMAVGASAHVRLSLSRSSSRRPGRLAFHSSARFRALHFLPSGRSKYANSQHISFRGRRLASFSSHSDLLSSPQSATAKRIKNLLQKRKKRAELGQTVVEGPKIVFDLLQNDSTRHLIEMVLVDQEKQHEFLPLLQAAQSDTKKDHGGSSFDILWATKQVLRACSDTVTPQGIVAVVSIPTFDVTDAMSKPTNPRPNHALYLVLDGVSDPGNTGTLLRTAVATGVSAVLTLPGCCDVWNPKCIRSAMSASFLVPSMSMDSWTEAENYLANVGVQDVFAATMMDNKDGGGGQISQSHYNVDWCQAPTALVIGSEGPGLSSDIRQRLSTASRNDEHKVNLKAVHVDMCPGIESLNAAVCGSVILFESFRQSQEIASARN